METRSSAYFQIGDAHLALDSSDAPLTERFQRLYGDCEVDGDRARGLRVTCRVGPAPDSGDIVVDVHDSEPIDLGLFLEAAFGARGCQRLTADADGWQRMACADPALEFRIRDRRAVFASDTPWRAVAANLAMGMALRVQHDIIYLHASGVALDEGRRGLLFIGPKGAGKTTTALGLASRGHVFLGDEMVGVRQTRPELVPVLRAISKRDGPCARAVDDALAAHSADRTEYPGGEMRTQISASRLFSAANAPAPLTAIVFLDGFSAEPQLTPMPSSLGAIAKLTPIASTLWGRPQAARAFALMKLLASAPSYLLRPGPPDATSPLLEHAFAG